MRAVCILALLSSPALAFAQSMDRAAQVQLKRGVQSFRRGDYQAAIDQLRAGLELQDHPHFYFPLAQAYRLAGDCASARPFYQKAINAFPSEEARIREVLAECPEPKAEPKPEPEPEPEVRAAPTVTPPPPRAPDRSPPRGRPFYLDPIGDGLAIGGLVAAGVGVGFLVAASNTDAALDDPDPDLRYDSFLERVDKANRERFIGIVATSIGGALLAGATVRWVLITETGADFKGVALRRRF